MRKFIVRALCAMLCFCMIRAGAAAAPWPDAPTAGQQALMAYIDAVNEALTAQGEQPVNSVFECWPTLAVLGITEFPDMDVPESVEMTFALSAQSVDRLDLRVSETGRFTAIASALIRAASGNAMPLEEARREPAAYVKRVGKNPENSFADTVIPEKGDKSRVYFAYYPNQYHDGVNWLCMTLIFARDGTGSLDTTPEPDLREEKRPLSAEDEYEYWVDYGFSENLEDMDRLDVTISPSPEPDSPANPYN